MKTLEEHQGSLAAPLIFMIVIAFQILSRVLEHLKKVPQFNMHFIFLTYFSYYLINV